NRVQEKLSKNHKRKKPESQNRYPFILTEVISCGVCGEKLCGRSAHNKTKKHPYYEHARRTTIQMGYKEKIYNCDPHRIPAEKAEELVWKDIEELLTGKLASVLLLSVMKTSEKKHHTFEIERLKNKTYSINAQVE